MSPQTPASEEQVFLPHSRVECRVYERHPSQVATVCQPIAARGADDIKWSATVREVSLGGIGLVINRRFERGVALAIELPEAHDSSFYTAFARVVHIKAQPDGHWHHGCAFVVQLSEDGLEALVRPSIPCPDFLAEPVAPSPVPSTPLSVQPPLSAAPPVPEPANESPSESKVIRRVNLKCQLGRGKEIIRSISRLKVSGPWPLPKDAIVRGWLGKGSSDKVPVRMKVSRCQEDGESWTVVCNFVEAPAPEVLRLLLGKNTFAN